MYAFIVNCSMPDTHFRNMGRSDCRAHVEAIETSAKRISVANM